MLYIFIFKVSAISAQTSVVLGSFRIPQKQIAHPSSSSQSYISKIAKRYHIKSLLESIKVPELDLMLFSTTYCCVHWIQTALNSMLSLSELSNFVNLKSTWCAQVLNHEKLSFVQSHTFEIMHRLYFQASFCLFPSSMYYLLWTWSAALCTSVSRNVPLVVFALEHCSYKIKPACEVCKALRSHSEHILYLLLARKSIPPPLFVAFLTYTTL